MYGKTTGDFAFYLCRNLIYHATYLSKKILPSLQLAVGKFMTECFMNHESSAMRFHVGPSLGDCARLNFL